MDTCGPGRWREGTAGLVTASSHGQALAGKAKKDRKGCNWLSHVEWSLQGVVLVAYTVPHRFTPGILSLLGQGNNVLQGQPTALIPI